MESRNEEEARLKINACSKRHYDKNKTKILARNRERYSLKKGKDSSLPDRLHSNYMLMDYKILKEGEHYCLVCNKNVVGIRLAHHINSGYHQKRLDSYKARLEMTKTSSLHKVFLQEVEKYKESSKDI